MADLQESIRRAPYQFICEWAEKKLPFAGEKVLKIASLMPLSIILPDFLYEGETIRSNINLLLIGLPGGGKSTLSKLFSEFTYFPLKAGSMTPAKLESKIEENPNFSFIVEDFSRMARNPEILKIIESLIGEEKTMKKATMRGEIDIDVNGVAFLCGTNQDLSAYLTGGFIFRTVPVIIRNTESQHSIIGKNIIEKINVYVEDNKKKIIKEYYEDLLDKHNQIAGFVIRDEFKIKGYEEWNKLTKRINSQIKTNFNWFRELHEFFRFMVAHAYLNFYNRKIENNLLVLDEEDFKIGLDLMKETIRVKYDILSMKQFSKTISDIKEFEKLMSFNNKLLSEERKEILKHFVNFNKGKVAV